MNETKHIRKNNKLEIELENKNKVIAKSNSLL